jgi:hypothetical protein
MINPAYKKGSRIHFVLDRLARLPISIETFRADMSLQESTARIHEAIIDPLLRSKYMEVVDDKYRITPSGLEKLHELGFVKPRLTPSAQINRMVGHYDGKELRVSVERRGADDHMQHPSRRNNNLYYKDGRVEAV